VQIVRMRTGEQGRFPYCCWRPGVRRPEAVVPKIHEVHKRETAVSPFFSRAAGWAKGAGVGRGAGEVGVRGKVRRGGSTEAGKGDNVREGDQKKIGVRSSFKATRAKNGGHARRAIMRSSFFSHPLFFLPLCDGFGY
jgi:hypothetical protein